MKSFNPYWRNKIFSGQRYNTNTFYRDKVEEHMLLLTDNEKKMQISDIGCGAGELLYYLVNKCNVVEAVDYSPSMLNQAEKLLKNKALHFCIKEILKLSIKEIVSIFTGKYKKYMIEIGEMGYAYRPHFWIYLADKHNLNLEIVSSLKYEYRYHVVLRKYKIDKNDR